MKRPSFALPAALAVTTMIVAACTSTGAEVGDSGTGAVVNTAQGAELFANNCARCHGVDATGTDAGPSFLDPVYRSDHHADESFQIAAARGVQPHHWDFGPMPAVGVENDLTRDDVAEIIAHVRSLQRAAGIE